MAKVTLRNLAAHKLRLVLTAVSVVLGVAMVAGTFIFTDTMSRQFDDLFNSIGKGVAVDVRGKQIVDGMDATGAPVRPPVPAAVLDRLRTVEGVKNPIGNVTGYAALIGKDGKAAATVGPPQLGVNWVETGGSSDFKLISGRAPAGPAEAAVDESTLERAGYKVGDQAKILLQGPTHSVTIVGVIETPNLMGATVTAFDTATAQRLLLKPGFFSDISMDTTGVSQEVLRDRVAQVLPAGMEAITGKQLVEEGKSDIEGFLTFFRTLLLVFGLIAVFVGAFIIFNTFSMLVAQRTRELALLRAIGASRRQVTRAVLGEAFAVGVVGSTLGLAAGYGIATLLNGAINTSDEGGLVFTATPVIWSYVVGVTITVVAAYFPARRAAKTPPVAAMREEVRPAQRTLRLRVIIGTVMTVGGAAAVFGGLASGTLELLGVGAFLVFLGVTMLAPVISQPVIRLLGAVFPRLFGTPGRLARENALRNPRRTASTASALMIGLALVSGINVVQASAVSSIGQSIDKQFGADYILMSETQMPFSPEAFKAVSQAPGVERATALYMGQINVEGKALGVQSGDTAGLVAGGRMQVVSGSTQLGKDGILVSEDVAKARKWTVGSPVAAQFADGARQQLRVAGIYARNDLLGGAPVLPLETYLAHTAQPLAVLGLIDVANADTATRQGVERALAQFPNLQLQNQAELKETFQKQLDQLVVLLTILLAMSIIIAVIGVVNTLALSVIERTREIGLLRAVGTSRRQLRRMIRLESVVIAVFGTLLGVVLGVAFGAAIQNGLADSGLQVLSIPVPTLAVYVVLGGVVGVLAALWPAWRAGRMDVLKAIATE
ncbi:ABC transporter permease [Actinomadura craniellae]|uniref:ABC transporter permease n=2 Tax=Actinomadura craniellae TaxID=2231787 RepID=A0A365H7C6_9ACTN|nr:ABC transporter permease [Actinomadura craniellae]